MSEHKDKKPDPNELAEGVISQLRREDEPSRVGQKPLEHHTSHIAPELKWHQKLWRDHKRLVIAGLVLILALGVTGGVFYAKRKPKTTPLAAESTPTPTPEPTKPPTKASLLTGIEMDPAKADQPLMASIIENLAGTGGARPQSGLSSAGVVYEALAEGGITRYLAVWQTDIPTDIGPVRSMRPVFFDTAMEYNTPVAHAGGSTDGLALVNSTPGFRNIEALASNAFRRITTRYAPHNLYIFGPALQKLVADKGWGTTPTFTPWLRKDDAPSTAPNATSITLDFSSADYRAGFTYDAATDSYLRTIAGKPDVDAAAASKQINPKTVIVVYATASAGTQPNGKPKTDIDITGTGKGIVFEDGIAIPMTWQKSGSTARMKFIDGDGKEIALNRGQSWVSYVPPQFPASYK